MVDEAEDDTQVAMDAVAWAVAAIGLELESVPKTAVLAGAITGHPRTPFCWRTGVAPLVQVVEPDHNPAIVDAEVSVACLPFNCVCTELVASKNAIVAALTPFVEVGVIAPRVHVSTAAVVGLATVQEKPLAVATPTEVTVPDPPPPPPIEPHVPLWHEYCVPVEITC